MVAKSPIAPFAAFTYTIEAAGIVTQGEYRTACMHNTVHYCAIKITVSLSSTLVHVSIIILAGIELKGK